MHARTPPPAPPLPQFPNPVVALPSCGPCRRRSLPAEHGLLPDAPPSLLPSRSRPVTMQGSALWCTHAPGAAWPVEASGSQHQSGQFTRRDRLLPRGWAGPSGGPGRVEGADERRQRTRGNTRLTRSAGRRGQQGGETERARRTGGRRAGMSTAVCFGESGQVKQHQLKFCCAGCGRVAAEAQGTRSARATGRRPPQRAASRRAAGRPWGSGQRAALLEGGERLRLRPLAFAAHQ